MVEINTSIIEEAVYKLCFDANVSLDNNVYSKILSAYHSAKTSQQKGLYEAILQNAKIANENKRPLCQDTGQVIVFMQVGQDVHFVGKNLNDAINDAVEKCYVDNFFRKSVVKNALFDRSNTTTNTPVIIYPEFIEGEKVNIDVLIKGGGAENKSAVKMLLPTSTREDVCAFIKDVVLSAGVNACPPLFVGVGVGGTMEQAALISKKALLGRNEEMVDVDFSNQVKDSINKSAPAEFEDTFVLDLKVLSTSTHIASLPVAVTINCHSSREASCSISEGKIEYLSNIYDFGDFDFVSAATKKEVFTSDFNGVRNLKTGEEVLLSGEIYVARDAAHQRIFELMEKGENLPFDLTNSIILYAGPCPASENEVIGPIGPTTSSRMDKFAPALYERGLLATIGKGERSNEVKDSIIKNSAIYFTLIGGIASLLSSKVKEAKLVDFEDLGAEAIYKLKVDKLPAKVSIGR